MTTIREIRKPKVCPDCGAELQAVQDGDPRIGPTHAMLRCPWTKAGAVEGPGGRLSIERVSLGPGRSYDIWACGHPYYRSTRVI